MLIDRCRNNVRRSGEIHREQQGKKIQTFLERHETPNGKIMRMERRGEQVVPFASGSRYLTQPVLPPIMTNCFKLWKQRCRGAGSAMMAC
jgi:hypothetical protein